MPLLHLALLFSPASCSNTKLVCASSGTRCYDSLANTAGTCPTGTTSTSMSASAQQCAIEAKPAIYLHPPRETAVEVRLHFRGRVLTAYPATDLSAPIWRVTARPDGALIDSRDGSPYRYLFWERTFQTALRSDFLEGFVVASADTANFLRCTLA